MICNKVDRKKKLKTINKKTSYYFKKKKNTIKEKVDRIYE